MRRVLPLLLLLAAGCGITSPDPDVITMEVGPNRVPCVGEGQRECLLVRDPGDAEWGYFYGEIEGFTFEPGYQYVLRVARREIASPPADGSSVEYMLVRVVSKDAA